MASILEILNQRKREQRSVPRQRLVTGVVIQASGTRYSINDGMHTVDCESIVSEQLRPGDRVWVAQTPGVSVIIGLQGRDKDF